MKERIFTTFLREIATELGLKFFTNQDGWYSRLEDSLGKVVYTYGYNFPLNDAVVKLICLDKVVTSEVLEGNNIPNIKHFQVFGNYKRKYVKRGTSYAEDVENILKFIQFPIVVKPTNGTTGRDVFLCKDKKDLLEKLEVILEKEDACLSEYVESEFEYRFYCLDGEVKVAYKKIKGESWKHNLSSGAKPEILTQNEIEKFENVCREVFRKINLRVGAIDFLCSKGEWKILEINTGISMDHFSSFGEDYREIAKNYHVEILKKCFG